jgi:hypothetical protein
MFQLLTQFIIQIIKCTTHTGSAQKMYTHFNGRKLYVHTSYVTWSYSHASSDICWENTVLYIVMIIQFNFENNTQIPSVKVCIQFLADSVYIYLNNILSFISLYIYIFLCCAFVGLYNKLRKTRGTHIKMCWHNYLIRVIL